VGYLLVRISLLRKEAVKGNNLLLEEYMKPTIPLKWSLVLIGTIITHLFGGSAGREGTAVQGWSNS
jgi:H+/Cl- antiporter ClcA